MRIVSSFDMPSACGIAASEEFLYLLTYQGNIASLTHGGTQVAESNTDKWISSFVLGPGGLLFCTLYEPGDPEQGEIVALDAQTLQPSHRFGLSLLNDVCGLAVVGEELFVCSYGNDRLQVFSLAGEHRRSITGEWKRPLALCFVKDRLYLVENANDEGEEGELVDPLQGRRIFVLSLQGDTLQVYTNSVEGQFFDDSLCYFDGKLLVPVFRRLRHSDAVEGVVALCGV